MISHRSLLFCGIATLAALARSASAQTAPASPGAAAQSTNTGEIVVTAQRRAERLHDVPISITALTGARLESAGVNTTIQLATVTPGLNIPMNGGYAQPIIRGVGTSSTSPGVEPSVPIYVDGVYSPNQAASTFELNNISRIEVLKGPQGTLFGRNSTGGAILITTVRPSESSPTADGAATYGSFNEVRLTGYASAPIIKDVLAADVAVLYDHDDGYTNDIFLHTKQSQVKDFAVRGKLLWNPTSNLEVMVEGGYGDRYDGRGYALQALPGTNYYGGSSVIIPTQPHETALTFVPFLTTRNWQVSLHVKYDMPFATLTSITAYTQDQVRLTTDGDRVNTAHTKADLRIHEKTFTQELNLASNTNGRLSWVTGLYYYHDEATEPELIATSDATGQHPFNYYSTGQAVDAIAGYAETNYKVLDNLLLIGGIRYSYEQRSYFADSNFTPPPNNVTTDRHNWSAFTPRVTLQYSFNPQTNVYFSFNQGFKSGAYNITSIVTKPVDPETITAYEVGLKHSAGPLSINGSFYYYDYKNLQVEVITSATSTTGTTSLLNAATAQIYGADLEADDQVTPDLRLNAGLAWTHATYTKFPQAYYFQPLAPNPAAPQFGGTGFTTVRADESGKKMVRTPEITLNFGLDWRHQFAPGTAEFTTDVYYNGGFFWDFANTFKQPSYTLVNMSASFSPANTPLKFTVWCHNLTDTVYDLYGAPSTYAFAVAEAEPRSVGITISAKLR